MMGIAKLAAALLVAAMPYLLYAVAQTSRLHEATRSGDMERIRSALKPWKFIDGRDRGGATPLQIAIEKGNIAAAEFFLDRGASVRPPRNESHADLLVMAVRLGRINMVTTLLDHGASANNSRAICSAVEKLNADMVTLLLKHGADPNATEQDRQHVPALFCLPYDKRTDSRPFQVMEILLKHGANIEHRLPSGDSLLHKAMFQRPVDTEMMRFLVEKGFSLKRDAAGRTPLRSAARAKLVEAVRVLLEAGADANDSSVKCTTASPKPCWGQTTALHEAVELASHQFPDLKPQSVEITAMLLKHGARPDILDGNGRPALFLATRSSNHEAARLLLEAGASPEFVVPPGEIRHQSGAIDP